MTSPQHPTLITTRKGHLFQSSVNADTLEPRLQPLGEAISAQKGRRTRKFTDY